MSVKQFSAVYSPIEDRIVFGFNTTEGELYSFFLTRTIAKSLLDQSDLTVEQSLSGQHNERSSKLISEFQKEGLKKQINFEQKFDGGEITPLGKIPILVSQITLDLKTEKVVISLTLITDQLVSFQVEPVQLQALSLLIEKLANQAFWLIGTLPELKPDLAGTGDASPLSQLH